jgi:hypothetical protein
MKIFYALTFVLFISLQVKSQSGPEPVGTGAATSRIIKFYPNPATTIINFDFQKDYDKSCSFQIFSFVGKKVLELTNVGPKTIVNLTDFYRGIYIFQLRDRNGKVIDSGKFQVSR